MSFLGKCKVSVLTGGSPLWRVYLLARGVQVGSHFTCIGRPGLNLKRGSRMVLGERVTLCSSGMANPVAEGGRCRLATLAAGAELILHDEVGISSALICCARRVEVGRGTLIGGGVMILDTDFHPRDGAGNWLTDPARVARPVRIGEKCFIGARAIILKGVTIGDGAVVGAGAVVTRDVRAGTVVAGNPATEITPHGRAVPDCGEWTAAGD
jgi:acetyltransferase-like isoleucine patch superfamily enzyme